MFAVRADNGIQVENIQHIPNAIQNLVARRVQSAKNRLLQRGVVLINTTPLCNNRFLAAFNPS